MKFCVNCGKQLADSAVFCKFCGTKCIDPEPAREETKTPVQDAVQSVASPKKTKRSGKKTALILLCALLGTAILGAGGWFGYDYFSTRIRCSKLMESAEKNIRAEDYLTAEDACREVLELDEKNVDASLLLAEALIRRDVIDEARETLERLDLSAGDPRYEEYKRMLDATMLDPRVSEVNTENFPRVTLDISYGGTAAPSRDSIIVREDGKTFQIEDIVEEKGKILVSYSAPDTDVSDEKRRVEVAVLSDGYEFLRESSYRTPKLYPADVTLVSADVSEYPKITVYFRVKDADTGETVENLKTASFTIRERLQGGEYLAREVHSVLPLEGNRGLNIALAADKSDSISYNDMGKIKRVMTEFVNEVSYNDGDKVEILAFDSIVQQMCYYTNETELLINGINSMSTDGMTAFYDAVHDGVSHAALQGGARCVIAFTDGMDNSSRYTSAEVINYAIKSQVPVYIIGVGDGVEEAALRNIAESTGGRYWFIDDLYDLSEIFYAIYSEQKNLYAVEYISDSAADAYDLRDIEVGVGGCGYRATEEFSYRAVPAAQTVHTSRYELVKESLTWEQAAMRCQEMGGHLATVSSQSEQDQLIAMAEAQGVEFLWLGGYTSYDDYGRVFGHWVTGEPFGFASWSTGEPSRVDRDGTDEWYIMLWNIPSLGGWSWNDQRNDPVSVVASMADRMGFICEFEG